MKTKEQLETLAEDMRNRRAELNLARRVCDSNSHEYQDALTEYLMAEAAYDEAMEKAGV